MKCIIVSGPTAAGKDTVIDSIIEKVESQGKSIYKARYYTTRTELRPGENPKDKYFLSEQAFQSKLREGEIIFSDRVSDYQVGYAATEFDRDDNVIVNIDSKHALELKK